MAKKKGGRVTPKGTRPRGSRPRSAGAPDVAGIAAGLQERLSAAQSSLAEENVTGEAAGGAVSVVLNAEGAARSVHIAASVIDPADPELLEDLVLAALRNAQEAAGNRRSAAMQEATSGLGLDGLGLDDLLA